MKDKYGRMIERWDKYNVKHSTVGDNCMTSLTPIDSKEDSSPEKLDDDWWKDIEMKDSYIPHPTLKLSIKPERKSQMDVEDFLFKDRDQKNACIAGPAASSTPQSSIPKEDDGILNNTMNSIKESYLKDLNRDRDRLLRMVRDELKYYDYWKESSLLVKKQSETLEVSLKEINRLMKENKILKKKLDFIESSPEEYKRRKEMDPYDEENWYE